MFCGSSASVKPASLAGGAPFLAVANSLAGRKSGLRFARWMLAAGAESADQLVAAGMLPSPTEAVARPSSVSADHTRKAASCGSGPSWGPAMLTRATRDRIASVPMMSAS